MATKCKHCLHTEGAHEERGFRIVCTFPGCRCVEWEPLEIRTTDEDPLARLKEEARQAGIYIVDEIAPLDMDTLLERMVRYLNESKCNCPLCRGERKRSARKASPPPVRRSNKPVPNTLREMVEE